MAKPNFRALKRQLVKVHHQVIDLGGAVMECCGEGCGLCPIRPAPRGRHTRSRHKRLFERMLE